MRLKIQILTTLLRIFLLVRNKQLKNIINKIIIKASTGGVVKGIR